MSFSGRPGAAGGEVSAAKKRRRALLSSYYGITSAAAEEDAYDVNQPCCFSLLFVFFLWGGVVWF